MDSSTRRQRQADLWLALAMAVLSAVVWWEASKLAPAPFDPLGPKSFPMWIAAALGLLSVVSIVIILAGRALGRSETSLILGIGDEPPTDYALRPGLAVAAAVLTVIYVTVLTFTGIGFLWATIAYIGVLGWIMSDRTPRHNLTAAIIAVMAGGGITYLFTKIFILDLP